MKKILPILFISLSIFAEEKPIEPLPFSTSQEKKKTEISIIPYYQIGYFILHGPGINFRLQSNHMGMQWDINSFFLGNEFVGFRTSLSPLFFFTSEIKQESSKGGAYLGAGGGIAVAEVLHETFFYSPLSFGYQGKQIFAELSVDMGVLRFPIPLQLPTLKVGFSF